MFLATVQKCGSPGAGGGSNIALAGWLWRRVEEGGFLKSDRWAKQWGVLKGQTLYGYRCKTDRRAQINIQLPMFRISPAPEIRGRKNVFKIYSAGKL